MLIIALIAIIWAFMATIAFYNLRKTAIITAEKLQRKEIEALALLNSSLLLNKPSELTNVYVRVLQSFEGDNFQIYARNGARLVIEDIANKHNISAWPNYKQLIGAVYDDFEFKKSEAINDFADSITSEARKQSLKIIESR